MNRDAQNLNNMVYTDYYYRLSLLARSVFKWEGLPPHIKERWIERNLFYYGQCMFFEDPKIGLTIAQCADHGVINEQEEPTELTPVSLNGIIKVQPYENGINAVLMRNNDDRLPTQPTIILYAQRLTNIQRTIDVNINAQKTPVTVATTEKQQNTVKQIFKQVDYNSVVVYPDKEIDLSTFKVFKTDAPIVFPQLQVQKHEVWNEAMTFLGVNNANMDKRERLVTNEVEANNEQIELSAETMLKARQEAADEINRIFNTNISVKMRNAAELNKKGVNANLEGDNK